MERLGYHSVLTDSRYITAADGDVFMTLPPAGEYELSMTLLDTFHGLSADEKLLALRTHRLSIPGGEGGESGVVPAEIIDQHFRFAASCATDYMSDALSLFLRAKNAPSTSAPCAQLAVHNIRALKLVGDAFMRQLFVAAVLLFKDMRDTLLHLTPHASQKALLQVRL